MIKPILRSVLLYTALIGGFILMDLVIDRLVTGDMLNITHLIPAAAALLISFILLKRAMTARKQAEAVLRRAYVEMETRVRERTAELERANQTLHTEIAERRQAEQSRAESLALAKAARLHAETLAHEVQLANSMLHTLIETLPVGMVVVDSDGEIVLINLHARSILGNLLEGLSSNLIADSRLVHLDGAIYSPEEQPLNRALRLGDTTTGEEALLIRDDGSKVFILAAAGPVKDEVGRITSAMKIIQDITKIKTMEQEVRASEETARALMDASTESAMLIDTQGVVLAVNRPAAQRLNATVEKMVGANLFSFFSPEVAERRKVFFDQVMHIARPAHFEDKRDGMSFSTDIHPVFDMNGKIIRLAVFGQDVTEEKKAEQAIRASEEKFATVFHNSPDAIGIFRVADGTLLDVNESFTKLLGEKRSQIIGRNWREQNLIPDEKMRDQLIQQFNEHQKVANYELDVTIRAGQTLTLLVSLIPITINGEPCILAISHDITERKLAEEALHHIQTELAQGIQERSALEERQRLARELHDSVSQALYGISLGSHTALTLLETDQIKVREALNYVISLTQAGLTEMRALIFELRPESLELEGLVSALNKQTRAISARHGIRVELALCAEPDIPLAVKEALYRITQEALQNALKHSRTEQLDVRLICDPDCLMLEVCDNGIGFDALAVYPGHLGLRSMRERAARVGGRLEISSQPDCGTQIRVFIPQSIKEEG